MTEAKRIRTGRPIDPSTVIADLGDGLVLRRATSVDAEVLAEFNGDIHRPPSATEPDAFCRDWTRLLLTRSHPTVGPDMFTVVEDSRDGTIASTMNIIPQRWSYDGITLEVGRPELVGTHPGYRRRGLVRKQFAVVHQWATDRGMHLLAITGIPNYYRQFGYEMCVDLDDSRMVPVGSIPDLKDNQSEPFSVRPARAADLAAIATLDAQNQARSLLACVRGGREWGYELQLTEQPGPVGQRLLAVERVNGVSRTVGALGVSGDLGRIAGFVVHTPTLWGSRLPVLHWELAAGVPWTEAGPSVLRYLRSEGQRLASGAGGTFDRVELRIGNHHPAIQGLANVFQRENTGYAWFIRVPDLPGFLMHIRRVLESRLRQSPVGGFVGSITVGNYGRGYGVKLTFSHGRLTAAEPYDADWDAVDASFPDFTLLQMVTGWRSLDQLEAAFPDVVVRNDAARIVLHALFPRRPSFVWPLR